jgi:hypothetical protein
MQKQMFIYYNRKTCTTNLESFLGLLVHKFQTKAQKYGTEHSEIRDLTLLIECLAHAKK